jgi:hypothetical protein
LISIVTEPNGSITPLDCALIGGARSFMDSGLLSPHYIKGGGPTCTPHEVDRALPSPTNIPTDLGLARADGKHRRHRRHHTHTLSPPPIAMATGLSSSSQGSGRHLSPSLISLSQIHVKISQRYNYRNCSRASRSIRHV